jgi:hypothetical protein
MVYHTRCGQESNDDYHGRRALLVALALLRLEGRQTLEIATKLAGERSGLRLRQALVEAGVPVAN